MVNYDDKNNLERRGLGLLELLSDPYLVAKIYKFVNRLPDSRYTLNQNYADLIAGLENEMENGLPEEIYLRIGREVLLPRWQEARELLTES